MDQLQIFAGPPAAIVAALEAFLNTHPHLAIYQVAVLRTGAQPVILVIFQDVS